VSTIESEVTTLNGDVNTLQVKTTGMSYATGTTSFTGHLTTAGNSNSTAITGTLSISALINLDNGTSIVNCLGTFVDASFLSQIGFTSSSNGFVSLL
jgi:hypothetical protein